MTEHTPAGWTPAFPGQRPPFQPGHEVSMVDGHRSERRVGPLAVQIAADLLADPAVPGHLRQPMFAASVEAWAQAEAICRLMRDWLAERDLMAGLTAVTTSAETERTTGDTTRRKSTTRSVASVLDTLRRYEVHAAALRSKLGLDPASAAKVGRDLALARHLDAGATPLEEALDTMKRRRELAPGEGGADA